MKRRERQAGDGTVDEEEAFDTQFCTVHVGPDQEHAAQLATGQWHYVDPGGTWRVTDRAPPLDWHRRRIVQSCSAPWNHLGQVEVADQNVAFELLCRGWRSIGGTRKLYTDLMWREDDCDAQACKRTMTFR